MTFKKREDNEKWKRWRYVTLCGDLALEESMNLSLDKPQNEEQKYVCLRNENRICKNKFKILHTPQISLKTVDRSEA